MVQTTSQGEATAQAAERFYDALAPSYDELTSFEKRFVQEKPFFRLLVEKHQIKSALDAGSGTGFHSLLLAQLGVSVTALDFSAAMLKKLKRHAIDMRVKIETVESSFQQMKQHVNKTFDAVFCLGNTLPHLLTTGELRNTIESFSSLLKPKGILLIQLLNYERILAEKERVQNVREAGGKVFVRFYDYEETFITFNILTIQNVDGVWQHSLQSTRLRPVSEEELGNILTSAGFVDRRIHGSISFDPFDGHASRDLVVFAQK